MRVRDAVRSFVQTTEPLKFTISHVPGGSLALVSDLLASGLTRSVNTGFHFKLIFSQ